MPERGDDLGTGTLVPVGGGGEHDAAAVGRPCGIEDVAFVAEPAAESPLLAQRAAGEQVAGRRIAVEWLDDQRRAQFVEPAVPVPNGERVVGARVVLACLAVGGCLDVVLQRQRARVRGPGEQNRAAVRAEARRLGAARPVGHALGLAAAEIEHVDLLRLVVLALGGKSDTSGVGTPYRIAFGALARGETARRAAAAIGGHEPEVAAPLVFLVGRLCHRGDEPAAIRAGRQCARALHEPHILVGDGTADRFGRAVSHARNQGQGQGQQQRRAGCAHDELTHQGGLAIDDSLGRPARSLAEHGNRRHDRPSPRPSGADLSRQGGRGEALRRWSRALRLCGGRCNRAAHRRSPDPAAARHTR